MKTPLIYCVIMLLMGGLVAAQDTESLTADEQVMVAMLNTVFALKEEACLALPVSKQLELDAQRVLAQIQKNHPGADVSMQVGANRQIDVQLTPKE